jgi:hypothetical protein
VEVTDAQNNNWVAKFGSEVNAEVFATRIAWAVGYFVDTTYFVRAGTISGVKKLGRAKSAIEADGSFTNTCFELRDKNASYLKKSGWTWQNNPFIGTRELNGLKIVLMLTSNWDNNLAAVAVRYSHVTSLAPFDLFGASVQGPSFGRLVRG